MTRLSLLLLPLLAAPVGAAAPADLELVESWPVETTLDASDLRDTREVWLDMIGRASKSLDIETFYVSEEAGGSALTPVLDAVRAAAKRGVAVRVIADKKFRGVYPETLAALDALDAVEVRVLDMGPYGGGIMHAKYFVADRAEAYLGSANFDWRSLEHVRELGLRVKAPGVAGALADLFELDWDLAAAKDPAKAKASLAAKTFPAPFQVAGAEVTPVFSPLGLSPDPALAEADRLVALVDSAKKDLLLQALSLSPLTHGGDYQPALDHALRRAAVRGVQVRIVVADWSKRSPDIDHLQSLAALPNIKIKLSTIPQWTKGFVPFARVTHAKFLVVDSDRFWLGTSNWSWDYFTQSRNAGLIVKDKPLTKRLRALFFTDWMGPYTTPVEPGKRYDPPQIAD